MKHIRYSALVAIAAIAASCAKESTVIEKETVKDIPMEPMCIQTGDESETKTSLDGKTVKWTKGDQIAVFSNIDYSTGYDFPAADINGNTATFSGEVPAGTESFIAVYPPERVSSASASGAVVTIPSNQTPAEGTFGEELNITIAKGTKTPGKSDVGTIHFRNVCSYVKFTVPAYVSDVNSVTISSDNAIAGNLTIDYSGDTPSSKIAADGDKSIKMSKMSGSFGAGKTFIFVIAPGTVSKFSIDIETASGNWTRTVNAGFTAKAGTPVNLGTVDFKIASMTVAKVEHTYDGKTLTDTNLVIDNLNIPDGLTGYVKKVHIDIIPEGQSTAVRSADITDFSTQTSIAVNSKEYPYLPKRTYTIKSTYTMSDGTTLRETTGSFLVSAPTFEIASQPTIYTSYSVYTSSTPINGIAEGAEGANGLDGSSIYVKKGTVSIAENILTKYSSLASYTYTADGSTALNEGQNGNMGWSKHTVSSSFTFDGVTRNFNDVTCHVTGLPYTAAPPTEIGSHVWKTVNNKTNVSFTNNYVNLRGCLSTSITFIPEINSPSFYIPQNISIKSTTNYIVKSAEIKAGPITSTRHCTLYEKIGDGSEQTLKKSSSTSEEEYTDVYTGTLSTKTPYIMYKAHSTGGANDGCYSRIKLSKLEYN